jgi:hypothetical protein
MGNKLFIIKMETFNKNIQRNLGRIKYQLWPITIPKEINLES